MSIFLSQIAKAPSAAANDHFSAYRLDLQALGGMASPVMGFDHYRMRGTTFAPHPHAGFSAVSYVFEDSAGGLRNRDSLHHDLVIEPGALVWTQAGSGVVHDEFPAEAGQEVHGVQIFVNLSARNKTLAPTMWHLPETAVPVVRDEQGNHTRILSGQFCGLKSPLETAEPFDLLHVDVSKQWTLPVPPHRNTLIYVLSGTIEIESDKEQRIIHSHHAVGAQTDSLGGMLKINTTGDASLMVLSGIDPGEPIAVYGPFIMNTESELINAYERYRMGEMGRLQPQA